MENSPIILKQKQKQVDEDLVLGVLFPKCTKKHLVREFPLDKVEVCDVCELEHDTKGFPSHTKSKELFQESSIAGQVHGNALIFILIL